jgi:hypothetical protein
LKETRLTARFKRIVTGHDARCRAILSSTGSPPAVFPIKAVPGLQFTEVWRTFATPAPIDNGPDPTLAPLRLLPTPNGSVIRVLDIPPGGTHETDSGAAAESFAEIGASHAVVSGSGSHPFMHRTETVDYGILISGEIWLVVDDGEIKLAPGDIAIQRGTSHAWSNRSNQPARLVFVLLDGRYDADLARP